MFTLPPGWPKAEPVTAPPSGPMAPDAPPVGNPDGLSTTDYCALLPKRRHTHQAKGKVLWFPSTNLIMVPYEMRSHGGWSCAPVHDPGGMYPPGGYNLVAGADEIETAHELTVEALTAAVAAMLRSAPVDA